jgi:GntR family transcriptional regulator
MWLQVNPGAELPIYRQIMRQIVDAIAGGRLRPGDKLASHRDLAEALVIAPLTVKKAYDELEREGYLETQRGKGTFVAEQLPPDPAQSRERLREAARRLAAQARLSGVPLAEALALVEEEHESLLGGAREGADE